MTIKGENFFSRHVLLILLALAFMLSATHTAHAETITFDFESDPLASTATDYSLSVVRSPLELTFRRPGASVQIFHDASPAIPSGFGQKYLRTVGATADPLFVNISETVSLVAMDIGTNVAGFHSLGLQAFSGLNGSGTLLDTFDTGIFSLDGSFVFTTLIVSGSEIRSLRIFGGDAAQGMLIYDNLRVQPTAAVPEPVTLSLLATGLLGVGGVVRRKRSGKQQRS